MMLCNHLQPLLDLELSLGNTVAEKNEAGWEKCDLDFLLAKSFHTSEIAQRVKLGDSVKKSENMDAHYSENGELEFFCDSCKHMVRAPLGRIGTREYEL
jgi:hypothetical protein